ncbi:MAG: hypothetical protein ACFE9L_10650 [Candidatus Hodarchaeota archaeon]
MTSMRGRYVSAGGSILFFQVDTANAKKYGLKEVVELATAADEDYVEALKHWDKLTEVTQLKKTRKITKYQGLLKQQSDKGRMKIRKAHEVLKPKLKTLKDLPPLDVKRLATREAELLRQLEESKFDKMERELIQTEFAENRTILDKEGVFGIVKKIHTKLVEMDDLLADPIKAIQPRSTAAFCIILIAILIAIFAIEAAIIIGWFVERFLGNSNTKEIHDGTRVEDACRVNEILEDHKVWIGTIEGMENAILNLGYNGCAHCLPELHTD